MKNQSMTNCTIRVTDYKFLISFNFFVFLALLMLGGCASLSKGQIKAIDSFTASCDSFSKHPTLLFEEMANIRAERALWYSSTLSDPELRVEELNSVYGAYVKDMSLAKKAGVSVEILLTYKRSLKVLAGKARWEDAGREFRSLGRTLDSLVRKFNDLELVDALPLGIGKSAGRVAGYTAEVLNKRAQAKSVRGFVIQGDTLVKAVTEVLCGVLSSPSINLLIENEKRGVEQNYISYLRASKPDPSNTFNIKLTPVGEAFQSDKRYFELKGRAEGLTSRKAGIITAVKHLARAHSKLTTELQKGKQVADFWEEILEFNKEVEALEKGLKSIKF
ncbi:MAG: hypothetical protein CVU12_09645 [Bacteroidetes bacterium HGW-Bacteroidetes-7]|jgi:hypothetical protein|nr:MAG: hypothetical protein CVU12_09645 [Bacteroidetes bacterium HGW-Bacteroidetes-7]